MCGICGVVTSKGPAPARETVQKMVASLKHRGPDEEGFFLSENAALGNCRLAVMDVAAGHQPMAGRSGQCQVVFNGEIYNYPVLRRELEGKGYRFQTHCDTEVLAYLYEEEGDRFVEKLRGMFAVAVWDVARKKLLLARDPIGIKPLYYAHLSDGTLAFGSEIKALLSFLPVPETDPLSVVDYFSLLYIPGPRTIYRGIMQLPAAHTLVWREGKIDLSQFWEISYEKKQWKSEEEAAELLRNKLEESVKLHLASDVPLGVFLSGGIDSSSVTAMMARHSSRPVKTFTVSFGEETGSFDESAQARLVSKAFGTDHTDVRVDPDIFELLPKMVEHFDQPFADSSSLLTFLLSSIARQKVTVALTGIGGDELFGGYPRYQGVLLARWMDRLPAFLRRPASRAARLIPESLSSRNVSGRIKRFLSGALLSDEERYLSWVRIVGESDLRRIFEPAFWQTVSSYSPMELDRYYFEQSQSLELLDRVFFIDFKTYLPDDLLAMGDRMSMAHSLELRVPFCDSVMAEFSASLPPRWKVSPAGLKLLLKKAMRPLLPPELFSRPKQGFMFPVGKWIKTKFSKQCREFLLSPVPKRDRILSRKGMEVVLTEHENELRNHGDLIFALMAFTQWCLK